MANQENEMKRMTIVIAGRSYPVKVNTQEERILPTIEKSLNDQIRQMQLSFDGRDMQDCLTMVLLTQALKGSNNSSSTDEDTGEKLNKINRTIESVL